MRRVLGLLGNRYGGALVLLALIAMVVTIGKVSAGPQTPHSNFGADVPATPTVSEIPDDGVGSFPPPPSPSTSPGAPIPAKVATDFTHAWLASTGVTPRQWRLAVGKYATPTLSAKFANTDPADVPAASITGKLTVIDRAPSYVDITVPLDTGTLSLRLIATNGQWLVDGVDWQRT
jgi:hypothetical protein